MENAPLLTETPSRVGARGLAFEAKAACCFTCSCCRQGRIDRSHRGSYLHTCVYTYPPEHLHMAFHVKDKATDKAVRRLAQLKGKTLTETIREAVEREYERVRSEIPLVERLKPIQDLFASLSKPGGLPADKAFFDELSGDA
jgi:antitoxin VapB